MDSPAQKFGAFVDVIKALRTPGTGCPWDLQQDHLTLRPFLIEEAFEVLDAIEACDDNGLREELGDLLLQVVLHAQVAQDRGAFSIAEVVDGIRDKMVRRHPHVFGAVEVEGADEVIHNWEAVKQAEAAGKGEDPSRSAKLRRLPLALPALQRAQRIIAKAAKLGFNLPPAHGDFPRTPEGLGDLLFQLCRWANENGLEAEECLRAANKRAIADCEAQEQRESGEIA